MATVQALTLGPASPLDAERQLRRRTLAVFCALLLALAAIAGQLVRLALKGGAEVRLTLAEPLARRSSATSTRRWRSSPPRFRGVISPTCARRSATGAGASCGSRGA